MRGNSWRRRLRRGAELGAGEVLVALLLLLLDVLSGVQGRWPVLLATGMAAVGVALTSTRWRAGAALVCLALPMQAFLWPRQSGFGVFVGLLLVYALAARRHTAAAAVASLVAYASMMAVSWRTAHRTHTLLQAGVSYLLVVGLAWLLAAATRQARAASERKLLLRLEHQRREIAGELHDGLSHELALLAMRAEEARLNGDATPDDLALMAEMSRRAGRSLRSLMGLLQVGDDVAQPLDLAEAMHDGEQRLRSAGFTVNLELAGPEEPDELPVGLSDLMAKVCREAVNNIVRHGDRRVPCAIFMVRDEERLTLAFTNGATAERGPARDRLGVVGMRQRVEAVGGTFDAGRRGRMWQVRAAVPLQEYPGGR